MSYTDFPPSTYFQQNPVLDPYFYYTPTFVQYYDVIETVVIVEFAVLILALFLGLFFKFFFDFRERRSNRQIENCKATLINGMNQEGPFEISSLKIKRLSILIPALEAVDSLATNGKWIAIKNQIAEGILLPAGRRMAKSPFWLKRLKAARCFAFSPLKKDEEAILKLIHDPRPIIQYTALFGACKLGTERSAEEILALMSHTTRFSRYPLRDALRHCDAKTFAYLEQKLAQPISSYDKVSCLEILQGKIYHNIYPTLAALLHDPHKNLRLAAIRVLGSYPILEASQLLVQQLDHAEWETRAVAASALGEQRSVSAIPKLSKLLRDKVWWVRMNAALALRKMGEGGIQALEMQDPDIDSYAYDVSKFALEQYAPTNRKT